MSNPTPRGSELRLADLQLEVRIAATPEAVWRALTEDIGKWWPSAFYCGGGAAARPGQRRFAVEARPGGRMFEDWGNGDGLVWGSVVNVVANCCLELTGMVGPAWGGPATWYGGFALTRDGAGTKLRFSESGFGRITDATLAEKEKGWRFLLDGALRAHLEGGEPPQWSGDG